jgi:molecular chaperone GrpE
VTAEHEPEGPVIRDKRRIDPQTGQLREPRTAAASSAPTPAASPDQASADAQADVEAALAERTADLQRLQAEYVNYKRRVDRDRETARHNAISSVLASLLPVLDDIARAREHDELSGGFKAVAESLERTMSTLGLQSFGEPGERFDPRVHEALMHSYSDDVTEPVAAMVLQVGYRHGDRILRPARVAVAEPPVVDASEATDLEIEPSEAEAVAVEASESSPGPDPVAGGDLSDPSGGSQSRGRLAPDDAGDRPEHGENSDEQATTSR